MDIVYVHFIHARTVIEYGSKQTAMTDDIQWDILQSNQMSFNTGRARLFARVYYEVMRH